jgi:alpha-glucosidase (family GH31 glycosyl hydrolase)
MVINDTLVLEVNNKDLLYFEKRPPYFD